MTPTYYTDRSAADAIALCCPELGKDEVFHNLRSLPKANKEEICELVRQGRFADARRHVIGVETHVNANKQTLHRSSVSFMESHDGRSTEQSSQIGFMQ